MLAFHELQSLTRQVRRSGLSSVQITGKDYAIRITCLPNPTPSARSDSPGITAESTAAHREIVAPTQGRVWWQDPLSGRAIGASGKVKTGDLLALVQSGQLYLPVRAPQDGVLGERTTEQGQRVECDQTLLTLREDHQ